MSDNIKHIALIMDGNARWAKANNLLIKSGHKQGAEIIRNLIPFFLEQNIPYVSFYAFSSENWRRPTDEVNFLLQLFSDCLIHESNELKQQKIKLKIIGNFDKLENDLQSLIKSVNELQINSPKLTLCIAFDYGSRAEIVDACNKIIKAKIRNINEENIKNYFYDPKMPDVDILIRTASTFRISNFLLWQIAYAELFFLEKFWPELDSNDLKQIIKQFKIRKRNFGAR